MNRGIRGFEARFFWVVIVLSVGSGCGSGGGGMPAAGSWSFGEVRLASEVIGAPLDVRPEPAVVSAKPNRMQRVVFRVHNPSQEVRRLSGRVELAPSAAEAQVSIFAMQCGEYTEVEPGASDTFAVVFSVKAAGLSGVRTITLRHVFAPATEGR